MLLDKICFFYGDKEIFRDFSLEIQEGEITVILGDSGVGKTTLLQLLAGLNKPVSGVVPEVQCGYVFQEPRLLPTLTVLQNVQIVLPKERKQEAEQWLQAVELTDAMSLYPHQLSGGMAQRAAMARAFAYGGECLLMDEPFRGLDVALQARLQQVFLRLWQERHITTVWVTHDLDEAVSLGHRALVLRQTPCRVVYQTEIRPDTAQEARRALRDSLMQ